MKELSWYQGIVMAPPVGLVDLALPLAMLYATVPSWFCLHGLARRHHTGARSCRSCSPWVG